MLTEYNVLKPDLPRTGGAEQEIHDHWREERREMLDAWTWPPETNVRHAFNALWRERFWSIQVAHDRGHWGWIVVSWLFWVAQAAAMGGFLALSYW